MRSHRVSWLLALALVPACAAGGSQVAPASSTLPAATSTTPLDTVPAPPSTTIPVASSVVEWLEAQRALGRHDSIMDPGWAAEEATIVTAFTQTPSLQGDLVVALADGRVAEMPPSVRELLPSPPTGMPDVRLTELGGDPLLVFTADDRRNVIASRLDPVTLSWTDLGGISPLTGAEQLALYTAGDHALFVHFDISTDPRREWGEVVAPDGTVSPMATPPEGTLIWFTNDAGGRALLLGLDTVAGEEPDLRQPLAYDPVVDEWLPIPAPGWLDCGPQPEGCVWSDRHEGPDGQFFRTTPSGVVVTLPDGTIGLLDPISLAWRRLDDPPIPLPGPIVAAVGDHGLVALPGPEYDGTQALGVAAWLDVSTGTWTTDQIVDVAGMVAPVWWEALWWGDVVLLGFDPDEVGNPPAVAIDLRTGEVRAPAADELAVWPALQYQVPVDDAIHAWALRTGAP